MRFTARSSSRSRDTPSCECGGRAGRGSRQRTAVGRQAERRPSALQGTLCSRLELPQPPHRLFPPINHADALLDQVSAGFRPKSRCLWEGLPGWGLNCLGRGLKMLVTPAWLLPAELARTCQDHLQRTVKYGGRQRLPSPGEMQAFLVMGVQVAGHSGSP